MLQALIGLLVLLQFNRFAVLDWDRLAGDGRGLSVHEAHHVLAADRSRPRVLLGRADGLGGGFRPARSARAFLLYAGSIAWVIAYDTIYAHQDREDDALIGSNRPRSCSANAPSRCLRCSSAAAVVLIGLAGIAGWRRLDLRARPRRVRRASRLADCAARYRRSCLCLRLFKSNRDAGLDPVRRHDTRRWRAPRDLAFVRTAVAKSSRSLKFVTAPVIELTSPLCQIAPVDSNVEHALTILTPTLGNTALKRAVYRSNPLDLKSSRGSQGASSTQTPS